MTEKDRNNILYAIEKDIDFIAHSFVRNRQDVLDIREILDAHNSDIKIIAKIENQEGVDNIDEILEVADGVMVARGDLGIEVPQERIPGIQRVLIRKCILAKKPVIVATQMLHTMINNPQLKIASSRATWLGNDQTHYEQKYTDKDIDDLKRLIELSVHWISMICLTDEAELIEKK